MNEIGCEYMLGYGKNVSMVNLDGAVRGPGEGSNGTGFVWAKSPQTRLKAWIMNCMRCRIVYIVL